MLGRGWCLGGHGWSCRKLLECRGTAGLLAVSYWMEGEHLLLLEAAGILMWWSCCQDKNGDYRKMKGRRTVSLVWSVFKTNSTWDLPTSPIHNSIFRSSSTKLHRGEKVGYVQHSRSCQSTCMSQ
ncbi:uncharacterized protein LOC120187070 isoform X2 [Hibiscus syriacus]|uniref:uncharacterized protein LOC120187070 isoform X2 n=1 Tax=Hibiscus syriacus TaxID=106335 RepID=UPI001924EB22|nr:uncharacterized protein LOC120187070 isoform X2 [Hibiscus syriacus]